MLKQPPPPRDPEQLLRGALEIFDGMAELLAALSPPEIRSAAAREARDDRGFERALWKTYEARHRVFTLAFGRQRSLFAELVRAYFAQLEPARGTTPPPDRPRSR